MKRIALLLVVIMCSALGACMYPPVGIDAAQDYLAFAEMDLTAEVQLRYRDDEWLAQNLDRYDFQSIHILTNPETPSPKDAYLWIPEDYDGFVAPVADTTRYSYDTDEFNDLWGISARVRNTQADFERNSVFFPGPVISADDWNLYNASIRYHSDGPGGNAVVVTGLQLFPPLGGFDPASVNKTHSHALEPIYHTLPPPHPDPTGPPIVLYNGGGDWTQLAPFGLAYVPGSAPELWFLNAFADAGEFFFYETSIDVSNLTATSPNATDFSNQNIVRITDLVINNDYNTDSFLYGHASGPGRSYLVGYEQMPDVEGSRWEWYTWTTADSSPTALPNQDGRLLAVLSDGTLIYDLRGTTYVKDTFGNEASFTSDGFTWHYEYRSVDGINYAVFARTMETRNGDRGAFVLRTYREPLDTFMTNLGLRLGP